MKNIHILPTDKPSRLILQTNNELRLSVFSFKGAIASGITQNIYITSDEEIKEGDWCLCSEELIHKVVEIKSNIGIIRFQDGVTEVLYACKKIILTIDQDLINDGVQAIDDEFLEWFVKNPSCESVEVAKTSKLIDLYADKEEDKWEVKYHIYIPKEEPKQELHSMDDEVECNMCGNIMSLIEDESIYACYNSECTSCYEEDKEEPDYTALLQPVGTKQETLEEALNKFVRTMLLDQSVYIDFLQCAEFGAKWQQERSYSEEDIALAFNEGQAYSVTGKLVDGKEWAKTHKKEWFEQFKKK